MNNIPFDPLAALAESADASDRLTRFPENSRYHGMIPKTRTVGGRIVAYLPRRIVPPPSAFESAGTYVTDENDRPDYAAHKALGDSLLFWRLADANGVLHPDELTARVGRRLTIPLPPGVPVGLNIGGGF